MELGDLGRYDIVVTWGAGESFANWYRKQFGCDYLVDNDSKKIGRKMLGIKIISPNDFLLLSENKTVLLIISVMKYYDEIEQQARQLGFKGDIVSIDNFSLVHYSGNQSFAQFGIDRFCCDMLRKADYDISDMSYIEIGANHPIAGNQTYLLYLLGARGLLVEPNPELVEVLKKYRPKDVVANCGLGVEDGELTFYRLDNSYRSSFDKKTVDMNLALGFKLKDTMSIPIMSFESLLKKFDIVPDSAYLSLEVMGLEKTFFDKEDIFRFGFPLIRVADHYGLFDEVDVCNAYVKIASFPRNVVFMRRNIYEAIPL